MARQNFPTWDIYPGFLNPPNGSWGMVKVRPKARKLLESPQRQLGDG